jgi:hypothetical protein
MMSLIARRRLAMTRCSEFQAAQKFVPVKMESLLPQSNNDFPLSAGLYAAYLIHVV